MFTLFEFQTICTFLVLFRLFFSVKTAACRLSRDSKCYPRKLFIIIIIIIIIVIIIIIIIIIDIIIINKLES